MDETRTSATTSKTAAAEGLDTAKTGTATGRIANSEPAREQNLQDVRTADTAAEQTQTSGTAQESESKGEKRYTDAEVDAIIDKRFKRWAEKHDKEVSEAARLAEMNATEKAEYERDKLQKELDELKEAQALSEMTKTARKMLADAGITASDEILSPLVTTNAEQTKAAIESFAKAFNETVEAAVKERLKGETPRLGAGRVGSVTKEQIRALKNRDERQRAMLEHKELFGLA